MLSPTESSSVPPGSVSESMSQAVIQWKAIIGVCVEKETITFQVADDYNRKRFREAQSTFELPWRSNLTLLKRDENETSTVMPVDYRMPATHISGAIEAGIMRPLSYLGAMQRLAAYVTHQIAEIEYIDSHPDEKVLVARTRRHRLSKAAGVSTSLFKKRT